MAISKDDQGRLVGAVVLTSDGVRRGPVRDVLMDAHTGLAEWVSVAADDDSCEVGASSGRFGAAASVAGSTEAIVPLAGACLDAGVLSVDVSDAAIRAVPAEGRRASALQADLTPERETLLYRHYQLSPAGDTDVDPVSGTTRRSRQADVEHSLLPPTQR